MPLATTMRTVGLSLGCLLLLGSSGCADSPRSHEPDAGLGSDGIAGDGAVDAEGTGGADSAHEEDQLSSPSDVVAAPDADAGSGLEYGNNCGDFLGNLFENADSVSPLRCELRPLADIAAYASNTGTGCVLDRFGTLSCCASGPDAAALVSTLPGTFKKVDVAVTFLCGIRDDGRLACFGDLFGVPVLPPWGRFTDLSCGPTNCCAIDEAQHLACWGECGDTICEVPEGTFVKVRNDAVQGAIAIRTDGTLAAWGYPWWIAAGDSLPEGKFVDVAMGYDWACAISDGGALHCWNLHMSDGAQHSKIPHGWNDATFSAVAIRMFRTCALSTTGQVVCWNHIPNDPNADASNPTPELYAYPYPKPEVGVVTELFAGALHFCAILESKQIVCWGTFIANDTCVAYL